MTHEMTDTDPTKSLVAVGPIREEIFERLRVLVVAGTIVGVLVAGIGSRLAMLVLRLTSPDTVLGVTSDDGFEIGRFTLGGTYNLMGLGAFVGIIGAAAYRAVAPWLLGPRWVRRVTVAAGSGAVVGSILISADGVDFNLLKPTWLAISLFIALPALFGATIAIAVDEVAARRDIGPQGWRRMSLPVVLVAASPVSLVIVVLSGVVLAVWVPLRRTFDIANVPLALGIAVRAIWLAVALWGLTSLVGDVQALT